MVMLLKGFYKKLNPSSYVWAMPKYIEFCLVLSRFSVFYVISLISPLSGSSPGSIRPVFAQMWPKARFIYLICLVLSRFSVFYVKKIWVFFFFVFSGNILAILTSCSSDNQVACYIFYRNSVLFCRIYTVYSGSLYGSMSNFDGLFLLHFYPINF